MGPGMPGIGFQKSVSAVLVIGEVTVAVTLGATDDIGWENWYCDESYDCIDV
jgi:hypothetical protein